MKSVRPKPLGAALSSLRLTPEEGFVLSRIDGRLSLRDLVALTGLEENRLEQIVTKLEASGAVALEAADPSGVLPDAGSSPTLPEREVASLADFAAALGMDPSAFAAQASQAAVEEPVAQARTAQSEPPPELGPEDEVPASEVMPAAEAVEEEPASATQLVDGDALPELEEVEVVADETAEVVANERNYRELYETKLHGLTTDVRVGLAQKTHGPELLALCFDADPRVVAAILENPHAGLDHARMIAFHHHTATGLEMVSRRQDWVRDGLVERRLLRNPQCGDLVLQRILAGKRLLATYKIAVDREVPELTRVKGRGAVRAKWQKSPPEERADFVLRTGGRCLALMTGCAFDAKTTQIICGRPVNDALLIQSFAKFPATPPGILAHLAKQPFVRKNAGLKKLLLAHPNMPGDVKRSL
jgi:hypothetical protein